MAERPELAVSAAIFRDHHRVLLVRRARPPANGLWTLPGGRVEIGETLVEAVRREVAEETGLTIDVVDLAGYREIILGEAVADRGRHFVILPFAARWRSGEVVLNEELAEHRWTTIDAIGDLPTTDGLVPILRQAAALVAAFSGSAH
jgi:ADP-ribose pyrophosphatase YjhB (NUDIX family)